MSTRLTKTLRAEIVEAVYKASKLPAELKELEKMPKAKFKELLLAAIPPGFTEMTKGKPKKWFRGDSHTYEHRYCRSEEFRGYMCSSMIGDYAHNPISLDDPVLVPNSGLGEYGEELGKWMYAVYRPLYQDWAKRRNELYTAANGVVNSYRTVKALLKAAPEFEQFVPKNHVTYPVPAIPISNALATFLASGVELKKAA